MKKFVGLAIVAFFSFKGFGQERAPTGPTYKCSSNCFFTSCQIECSATENSGAACTCWFGLAQCYCISVQNNLRVTQTEQQKENLALFVADVQSLKSTEGKTVATTLAKIRDLLQGTITTEKLNEYRQLANTYKANAEKLGSTDKTVFDKALERAAQRSTN
jgi:hypothetical protein